MASEDDAQEEGAAAVAAVSVTTTPHADVAGIVPSLLPPRDQVAAVQPPPLRRLLAGRGDAHGGLPGRPLRRLQAQAHRRAPRELPQVRHHLAQGPRLRHPEALRPPPARRRPTAPPSQPPRLRQVPRARDRHGRRVGGAPFAALARHAPPLHLAPESGCRVVYICRDPKDALVSYWHFTKKASPAVGVDARSFTIQDASQPGRPQWQHALRYWEESVKRPDKVLFLKYEEMLLDPESHLRKLAEFMGCGFSSEEEESGVVSAIVDLCSLGKMKDLEVNRNGSANLFGIKNECYLRKGVAGDWSNHMTPEMAERLDKIVEDALQGSGLTFGAHHPQKFLALASGCELHVQDGWKIKWFSG
ncbi:hypothetical protein HU200_013484 [Digitaria exilis]|uniref:Sulfotransferase n=1 Tax=Digitaria exilis TaxID=1010633 RepID=A0A835FEH6_9POAL|nr:hypothetical protein HU200_013484 [Digitaria exilis]